jgi:hypothetical protein
MNGMGIRWVNRQEIRHDFTVSLISLYATLIPFFYLKSDEKAEMRAP